MKHLLRPILRRLRRARPSVRAEQDAIRALAGTLDRGWYLQRYPDVAAAGHDPLRHFLTHGVYEDRQPNRFVDPQWYADFYQDRGTTPPLLHYAMVGRGERRNPGPDFSVGDYLSYYPDVAASGMEPLEHFIRHGEREGRLSFRVTRGGHASESRALQALTGRPVAEDADAPFHFSVPDATLLRIDRAMSRRR